MTNSTILDRAFAITGRDLCALMRRHKVTIRELAKRLGLPMKRVRLRRETGVAGTTAIDWHEAITGNATPRMLAAIRSYNANNQFRPIADRWDIVGNYSR